MAKKEGMNKVLKVILIVIGVIALLFVLAVVYYMINPSSTDNFYPNNELVMYGYKDYQDYLSNRPPEIAEIDDKFLASVLEVDNTRENASDSAVDRGWYYLFAGDSSTAMKRFNQAWLLNPTNYNVYWGFGVVTGQQSQTRDREDLIALSVEMFDKAIELYDDKSSVNKGDKLSLYCDAVYSNILKAETGSSSEVDKALDLLEEAKDMNFAVSNMTFINSEKARCHYYGAQIWFEREDYSKSWEDIELARELDPNNAYYQSDSQFIVALNSKMSEPK